MGKVRCKYHGVQGITLICEHLSDVDLTSISKNYRNHKYKLLKDETGIVMHFCDKCIYDFSLPETSPLTFDDVERVSDQLRPICSKCLGEIL